MTWIKTTPFYEADEKLRSAIAAQRELYPVEYAEPIQPTAGDETSEIVASHSLIPDALYHAFGIFGVLLSPDLPLGRRQQEMIRTVVSVTNRCQIEPHAEFLRRVRLDEELVSALQTNHQTAPISEQDRAMLDYVTLLTRDATLISPRDHARLRATGFDDRAILQITLIASWFNYINRVADALGVGRDVPTEQSRLRTPPELF